MFDLSLKSGLVESVQAIFVYGTLRPDYSSTGDAWGVTHGCTAGQATVYGFKLYQHKSNFYPFALHTGEEKDAVKGFTLAWPGDTKTFAKKLSICDDIEGLDESNPEEGLYKRSIVSAYNEKKEIVPAYIYHQAPNENVLEACKFFEDGDWLAKNKRKV